MTRLPQVLPRDVRRVLLRFGFEERIGKGSHRIYVHADGRRTILALHPKPLTKGVLHSILRQTQLTTDTLLRYL